MIAVRRRDASISAFRLPAALKFADQMRAASTAFHYRTSSVDAPLCLPIETSVWSLQLQSKRRPPSYVQNVQTTAYSGVMDPQRASGRRDKQLYSDEWIRRPVGTSSFRSLNGTSQCRGHVRPHTVRTPGAGPGPDSCLGNVQDDEVPCLSRYVDGNQSITKRSVLHRMVPVSCTASCSLRNFCD